MSEPLPPRLIITPGDPDGIGPEIVEKALNRPSIRKLKAQFTIIGAVDRFKKSSNLFRSSQVDFITAPLRAPAKQFLAGYQAGWSIETAARLCLSGKAQALVTGPIDKARLQKGGFPYTGHTDFLADLCQASSVTMMLANDRLRVSLVTVHVGIKKVSERLTQSELERTIQHTRQWLVDSRGVLKPRIAVLALNPHAGEQGIFGREEIDVIQPVIDRFNRKGTLELSGPFPADTFFALHYGSGDVTANRKQAPYDAVIAMYHDQGLIPVKMTDFERTVNWSLGLPIVRTSVDHGTAFDIAGQGIASSKSLEAAIEAAYAAVTVSIAVKAGAKSGVKSAIKSQMSKTRSTVKRMNKQ
ncbi:MAG: 4-hydroxythreonine-4-phosphate dehydrogenase PdxA [Proteobacteria bacterium]|nr:MAG: 4-hydroxythreonine-4-phosphate dehydrogenase PdxA [Pseudomonadota bacterium]